VSALGGSVKTQEKCKRYHREGSPRQGSNRGHRLGHGHETEDGITLDGNLCLSVLPANGLGIRVLTMSVNKSDDPCDLTALDISVQDAAQATQTFLR